jgi:type VI protein secretion system component VasF
MPERTEQLLSEILDVLRRQVANQEQALSRQEEAVAIQRDVVARQRVAFKRVWMLIVLILVLIIFPYAVSWVQWFGRH